MKTYTPDELRAVIEAHDLWLRGDGGQRADLQDADLRGANLQWAHLQWAHLRGALYKWAQVAFGGHGECGRMLTAYIQSEGMDPVYQCGCFYGALDELKNYIANGEECHKASRTLVMQYATKLLNA